ncbi:MAG: hypothetical protein U9P63_00895 [Patescibacteria group bacterium]|nr:hypothetical protein [Patescibacteria group bacterium]
MFFEGPRDTKELCWTRHIKEKMLYYRISEGRLKRILRTPQRSEVGIAPNTVALMHRGNTKKPSEIWLMYQQNGKKKKMISAWRYPGISPKGERIFIPNDVLKELGIREKA